MDQDLIYKAGVVPYRKISGSDNQDNFEILIVSARKYPGQWVFPVGTVEQGESFEEAAVRECEEESGYKVEIDKEIDTFILDSKGAPAKFVFFLGSVTGENKIWEDDRERCWCKLDDIISAVARPFKNAAEIAINTLS